jgi:hypothetical protein
MRNQQCKGVSNNLYASSQRKSKEPTNPSLEKKHRGRRLFGAIHVAVTGTGAIPK